MISAKVEGESISIVVRFCAAVTGVPCAMSVFFVVKRASFVSFIIFVSACACSMDVISGSTKAREVDLTLRS